MTNTGTALLITPQPARVQAVAEHLRLAGIEVHDAESGLHALTQLERLVPDVILCDADLEDMSGRELQSILRDDNQFESVSFLLLDGTEQDRHGPRDAVVPLDAAPPLVARELLALFDAGRVHHVSEVDGNLELLGLHGVLQVLGQGQRSGMVKVTVLSSEADVWLADGQVVNARYGHVYGEGAFRALLNGTRVLLNAEYRFTAGDAGLVPHVIHTPTPALLLEVG